MVDRRLVHTSGDVVLVMADDGSVRGWRVLEDGALEEVDPALASIKVERLASVKVERRGEHVNCEHDPGGRYGDPMATMLCSPATPD